MGKEQAITRNGHNLFEISSLIQKALRRSDKDMALYASAELLPKYRNYLWKRLLTVSAEDCHDMVTYKILSLHEKDGYTKSGTYSDEPIEEALSILLAAQKNRDADYCACNLFNSRDKRKFGDEYGVDVFDPQSTTKNGHNVYLLRDVFNKSIDNADCDNAGYAANEIRVYYPNFAWDMISQKASSLEYQELTKEVIALKKSDKFMNFDNTLLFRSKAIVLMCKSVKYGDIEHIIDKTEYRDVIHLCDASTKRLHLPDYVYDCHTYIGKSRGMTKRQFVKAEQSALRPFKQGLFDKASWERFFYMCDHGFWTEDYTPRPSSERIKEIENNQLSLF